MLVEGGDLEVPQRVLRLAHLDEDQRVEEEGEEEGGGGAEEEDGRHGGHQSVVLAGLLKEWEIKGDISK